MAATMAVQVAKEGASSIMAEEGELQLVNSSKALQCIQSVSSVDVQVFMPRTGCKLLTSQKLQN
jgi:hypothetical protein